MEKIYTPLELLKSGLLITRPKSRETVFRYLRTGRLKAERLVFPSGGSRWRIPHSAVEEFNRSFKIEKKLT